jgi:hypothetical protein
MADIQTRLVYAGNGTSGPWQVPAEYLSKSYIYATLNGNPVTPSWVNDSLVSIPTANGDVLVIERRTDNSKPVTDYQDDTALPAADLDIQSLQLLHLAQEGQYSDGLSMKLVMPSLRWDAQGRQMKSLGYPTTYNDAATQGSAADLLADIVDSLTPGGGANYDYPSKAAAAAATIPVMRFALRVGGNTVPGDFGAAIYKRVASEPSHAAKFNNSGWWEIAEREVVPEHFGAVGDGVADDTVALQAMLDSGFKIRIPKKTYLFTTIYLRSGNNITSEGYLNGNISAEFFPFGKDGLYTSVTGPDVALDPATTGAAITAQSSGFSSYANGDWVAVTVRDGNDWDAGKNQVGIAFSQAATATPGLLTLTAPIRWYYKGYRVIRIPANDIIPLTGSWGRGVTSITTTDFGDLRNKAAPGQVWRIENRTGLDSLPAIDPGTDAIAGTDPTAYFAYMKVKSVTVDTIGFEGEIPFDFGNPILVRARFIENVTLSGGNYKQVDIPGVTNLTVNGNARFRVFGVSHFYRLSINDVIAYGETGSATSGTPRVFGLTFGQYGTVSDVMASGAVHFTDNAAFKVNGIQNVAFSNLVAYDTFSSSTLQGIFPLMTDFFFTPYCIWVQGCSFNGAVLGSPKAGPAYSLFVLGTRDCSFENIRATGQLRITKSYNPSVSNLVSRGSFWFEDIFGGGTFSQLDGSYFNVTNAARTKFDGVTARMPVFANAGRCFYVRDVCPGLTLNNYDCRTTLNTAVSVALESPIDVTITNSGDIEGRGGTSVSMLNTAGTVHMVNTKWYQGVTDAAGSNGTIPFYGDLQMRQASWRKSRIVIGDLTYFADAAGNLRRKSGALTGVFPTNATDGAIVASPLRTGIVSPYQTVAPLFIGEVFVDTAAKVAWIATSMSGDDWKQVTP